MASAAKKIRRANLDGLNNRFNLIWQGLRAPQRRRIADAIQTLIDCGTLSRNDIAASGECSVDTATRDIAEIKKRAPGIMHYDLSRKCFVATENRKAEK